MEAKERVDVPLVANQIGTARYGVRLLWLPLSSIAKYAELKTRAHPPIRPRTIALIVQWIGRTLPKGRISVRL